MKAVKITLFALVGLVLLAFLAFITHPWWVGSAGKALAPSIVSSVTKTSFAIEGVGVNLFSGKFGVSGVVVENPKHFFEKVQKESSQKSQEPVKKESVKKSLVSLARGIVRETAKEVGGAVALVGEALAPCGTNAVTLTSLDVELDTLSTLSDVIHIRDVRIDGLNIFGDATFSNLREIAGNASSSGGSEEEVSASSSTKSSGTKSENARVVVDRVILTGAKIKWGNVVVPLPNIEVCDIGKESQGVTCESAFEIILDAVCKAADKACVGSGKALKLAVEGSSKVSEGVKLIKEMF